VTESEPPRVIRFSNPIDPDAPPIDADVDLTMTTADQGGLKAPLMLPTPSLVFRVREQPDIIGYTAMIEHETETALVPGMALSVRVRFIGVPAGEVWIGRTFALWHGRDVGTATLRQIAT
jgi:hypothetical protein